VVTNVGVLALQGGFQAHVDQLLSIGISARLVKKPDELSGLSALILPGGESTTLLKLMAPWNWKQAIIDFYQSGGFIFGTCAGMILLAKQCEPEQDCLGLIDIDVERNAYGRQIDSFIDHVEVGSPGGGQESLELVFIRAPKVTRVGASVDVLVYHGEDPVLLRQNYVVVASFHPELASSGARFYSRIFSADFIA
jgi:pyridoxal 5'-phosphate synthase pdxT subunit